MINRGFINDLYRKAAAGAQKGLLLYSEEQNVSTDSMGREAAVVIEGHENHTRTGFLSLDASTLQTYGIETTQDLNLPVTHAKILAGTTTSSDAM